MHSRSLTVRVGTFVGMFIIVRIHIFIYIYIHIYIFIFICILYFYKRIYTRKKQR